MNEVEQKLAKSLTAESIELIPYLPYLLQDLWELGSSCDTIVELISQHIKTSKNTRVLDLACGKGAVSINVAKSIGCKVCGIDIIPEFIEYANYKAKEHGVETLCSFRVEDINKSVLMEQDYDIVIFGAVGDVLGTPSKTLEKLKNTIKSGGYLIIDDAYGQENSNYPTKKNWLEYFHNYQLELVCEKFCSEDELKDLNNTQQSLILKRANELKLKYPERAELFDGYIKSQQAECIELENEITGVTMLLKNR